MTSYRVHCQTIDSKREEFRKYLEGAGVLDVFTRILSDLYEMDDKPQDVLSYVKTQLGVNCPDAAEISALKDEICVLERKVASLEKENINLKFQLTEKQN